VDDARKVLDFGAMLSFTGVLTYRNAPDVQEAGRIAPADRILVETDAPYLSPEPKRGVRPCTPAFARLTAERLAQIRGMSFDALELQLDANTHRFFGIDARGEQR
jgi:TatD DNase family protein